MADIKRAAMWMAQGKKVRRSSEPLEVFDNSVYFDAVFMRRCESVGEFARISLNQLLAKDWELVED